MNTLPLYVWLDLETSGLNPQTCQILEVYAEVTDAECKPVGVPSFHRVLKLTTDPANWDPFVQNMHQKNGLLEEAKHSTFTTLSEDWQHWVANQLFSNGVYTQYFAGNTVHFDRKFMEHADILNSNGMSHRHMDVSSLRILFDILGVPAPIKKEAHRAKDDVQESKSQYMYYYNYAMEKFNGNVKLLSEINAESK